MRMERSFLTYNYMFNNVRIETGEDYAVEIRVRISDGYIVYFIFHSLSCKQHHAQREIAKSSIIAPSYCGDINASWRPLPHLAYDVHKSAAVWQVYTRNNWRPHGI